MRVVPVSPNGDVLTAGDAEWLEASFGVSGEAKLLAVIWTAAIDDSADRDRRRVIVAGVVLGNSDQWRAVTARWRQRLSEDAIKYFRSSDCRNLRGQFFKFRDRALYPKPQGRNRAERIRADLDSILRGCGMNAIGAVIQVPIWKKFMEDPRYSAVCSRDPYDLALQTVWLRCTEWVRRLGRENLIAFVHDENERAAKMVECFRGYKSGNPNAGRLFTGIRFEDDKRSPAIQAADLAASISQDYALRWLDDPSSEELAGLRGAMYRIDTWNEGFTRIVLEDAIKRRGRASRVAVVPG